MPFCLVAKRAWEGLTYDTRSSFKGCCSDAK